MTTTEPIWDEEKQRLLTASKLIFLIIMIYSLWVALIIIGVYFLKFGNKWAILTVEQWILSAIVLISIAVGLEIILIIHFVLSKKKQLQLEKESIYLEGKQVHNYTIPVNAKGGIFSKTYILIDQKRVLNLRYQMIPPYDLWGQKQ
jgi:hypothetical protein